MRRVAVASALLLTLLATKTTFADEGDDIPRDLPRLILDTGRLDVPAAEPDAYRFFLRGEYQLRYQAQRSFLLSATTSAINEQPGLEENSIGQNHFVHHWLRITPRFQVTDKLEIVGQADLTGLLPIGDKARDTNADYTPRDEYNGLKNLQPRWLYAQYRLPFGLVRVGQQPNHWGMGILANDGDHPLVFGDYRYGSISERILFATKPGGAKSDFNLALAADLVFRDNNARLIRGQQAVQGVLGAFWERGHNRIGLFSTFRHQENDKTSSSDLYSYTDNLDAIAVDLHGKVVVPVPGETDSFVFAEAEAAMINGSTNMIRTLEQTSAGDRTTIRSYGGSAAIGVVHRSWASRFWANKGSEADARAASEEYLGRPNPHGIPYGDLVAQVEMGYASGDADPYDGVQKRFTFDPNHRIGLLLFDEVLRFQTARASTAAQDPLLTNGTRPTPGVDMLPSNGGVFGAQYVNPTVIVRPRYWLDLKAGMVVALATADVVDPFRVATSGSYVNYRGGDPRKRDLGVELDAGVDARFPLDYGLKLQVGAQGGVLFPGTALENAAGERLPTQWVTMGRLGVLF